jgi:hypothetical protein
MGRATARPSWLSERFECNEAHPTFIPVLVTGMREELEPPAAITDS